MSMKRSSREGQRQTERLSCSMRVRLPNARRAAVDGFFARHAGGDEFFDFFFEVLLDFGGEIVVEAAAREQLF